MLDKKCIIVAGCFGYIGNALCQRLLKEGYKVVGLDNGLREKNVEEMGSYSATYQPPFHSKSLSFKEIGDFRFYDTDVSKRIDFLENIISYFRPATIVNLAHQPSGPFSQKSFDNSKLTLENNINGTNNFLWAIKEIDPEIHYTTIGSTGEYSHYSNIDIEEGYITINHKGRVSNEMIYPRCPTSLYHASKVSSFYITEYLTRIWDLKTTEAEQSIVFGLYTKETDETKLYSRLDTDGAFGTVLNKFIVQALLDIPLTIFGEGKHQRGFIALQNSVDAIMLSIENPPESGRLRCFNQLSDTYSINELAETVKEYANKYGKEVTFKYIPSPRKEYTGEHYYNFVSEILPALGYKPTRTIEDEIDYMFKTLDIDYIKNLKSSISKNINF